ncbi:MAG: glycosyltransferase family 9 protein [Sedimentisphaerales bacterium]|jgi:lipopolysaccharide heptosyltransferase I
MMGDEPRRILIIKPSALGDIILALPALLALKRSFPGAKISWFVRPEFAPLITGHPYISDIILFDRRKLSKWWCSPGSFNALSLLVKQLRAGKFDLVFDFQGLFRTGFFSWVTGSKRRFGMAGARELAHLFYTDKISQDASSVHLVDYYLKMVTSAGTKQGEAEFKLPQDAGAAEKIDKLLKSQGVNGGYAVIVPGAAQPNKRWPIERFAELAGKISERFGLSIVATGSQGEREYIEAIQTGGKTRVINLAGKTAVRELIPLMKNASLVVSNDTGPGHIAAAMGVPIVMIFGPTNPARVCPYKRPQCVAAIEPNERGMKADSYEPKHDIIHITVEQVFDTACRQIDKKGA